MRSTATAVQTGVQFIEKPDGWFRPLLYRLSFLLSVQNDILPGRALVETNSMLQNIGLIILVSVKHCREKLSLLVTKNLIICSSCI